MKYFLRIVLLSIFCSIAAINAEELQIKMKDGSVNNIDLKELKTVKFIELSSVKVASNASILLDSLGNYPNPFTENTTINAITNSSEKVSIKIYTLTGILVYSDDNIKVINNRIELNFSSCSSNQKLNSGTYYYEIKIGDTIKSKSMMVIQ